MEEVPPNPLKILHTNFHRGWGGQSNRILTECRGLAERGHHVVLAVPEGSVLAKRGGDAGLEVFTDVKFARGFRPLAIGRDVARLRQLFRRERFDIIHTHGSQDSWAVAFALIGFRPRPIVLRTKHNIFPIKDHVFNRWLYGTATDGMVCISSAIVEDCAAKPYLKRENLALIPSAVDAGRFSGSDEQISPALEATVSSSSPQPSIRAEFGLERKFLAGVTGRLRSEKGHTHLLDAMPEIIKHAPNFVLLIVGSGSLEGELKRKALDLGVASHVVFTGFRTDIPQILHSLDLFVMPSISEGLGTAILEAASAGLPIVASRVGGIPDIIQDGETGLLVPVGDSPALAHALLTFYRDRTLARSCAEKAKAHVLSHFSPESLIAKTDELYRQWMNKK